MNRSKRRKVILERSTKRPLTNSTKENPIKAHRTKLLLIEGFLHIDKTKKAKMTPTPIATPARQIKGILEAKYRNPRSTIDPRKRIRKNKANGKYIQGKVN